MFLLLSGVCAFLLTALFEGRRLQAVASKSSPVIQTGQGVDYSKFLHSSSKHASLSCNSCHLRTDNAATPTFPGHKACTDCHLTQFVTPAVPMCVICHKNVEGQNPPLKPFPVSFKESFNVKFDHVQHMTGAARPQRGCQGCHNRLLNRGVAISIPVHLSAHNQCYVCHTPNSTSASGREMASCGVCHEQKRMVRTSLKARSYRAGFSHSKHSTRQQLGCTDCHFLTAGAPQKRQVSSPRPAEHFPARGMSCMSCHNGKRAFGGDLAFQDCQRCHTGPTFRVPL